MDKFKKRVAAVSVEDFKKLLERGVVLINTTMLVACLVLSGKAYVKSQNPPRCQCQPTEVAYMRGQHEFVLRELKRAQARVSYLNRCVITLSAKTTKMDDYLPRDSEIHAKFAYGGE